MRIKIITVNEFPTMSETQQLEKKYNGELRHIIPIPMRTPKQWEIHLDLNDPKLDDFMGGKK
ncbi:MAG: hypothetical protein ACTSP6_06080 [Promethearchaeota archaeon]